MTSSDHSISPEKPRLYRAWFALLTLSTWRLGWTMQSLAAIVLIGLFALIVLLITLVSHQEGSRFQWNLPNFTRNVIDYVYLSFLLPVLCLCFGTQALGGEWEERQLVWTLTRPIPRPLIYVAKFLALLPWTVGVAVAGLFLIGALAGEPGWQAVTVFWPVIVMGSLAYSALFLLIGSWFRRSTIVALTYSFVLETILGNMPGLVKRISIAFYSRCYLYGLAEQQGWSVISGKPGIQPDAANFFLPVDGETAFRVLAGLTVGLLLLGMLVFSRKEYRDLT